MHKKPYLFINVVEIFGLFLFVYIKVFIKYHKEERLLKKSTIFTFMPQITNKDLIEKARSITKSKKIKHAYIVGDVGCALLTDKGNIYLGVCMDVSSGIGFCAEHAAIASMVTHGEHKIKKIVAVSENGKILPPCGRCREFINQIHEQNRMTEVIIGKNKVVKLKELLPHSWS